MSARTKRRPKHVTVERQAAAMLGRLSDEGVAAVSQHNATCERCANDAEIVASVVRLVQRLKADGDTDALRWLDHLGSLPPEDLIVLTTPHK